MMLTCSSRSHATGLMSQVMLTAETLGVGEMAADVSPFCDGLAGAALPLGAGTEET